MAYQWSQQKYGDCNEIAQWGKAQVKKTKDYQQKKQEKRSGIEGGRLPEKHLWIHY